MRPAVPKISIVTPSFNQGAFLEECIDSVLSQNYPNLEYIIMDGGSTDNSVEIIKKYEKYLAYWQSKSDGGQYDAINEGFRKATGDIMAWLNSDDKYHHHAFFKVAYIFDKHLSAEWLTGRATSWDSKGNLSFIFYEDLPAFSREKYLRKDYRHPHIQQESTFWKRSLWEKAGSHVRPDLHYAGDLELWMRFFRFAPLCQVDTLLGGYRKHGDQKTELFMGRYVKEAEKLLDEEIELVKNGEFTEVRPLPETLYIAYNEFKKFIDNMYEATQHKIYKISDDSDFINDYLFHECVKYKSHANLEEVIKSLLVKLLHKFHLYNFYVRHEPRFSRAYHFFRKFFVPKGKRDLSGH